MANISVTFQNNTSDKVMFVIIDAGLQPHLQLFSDYLEAGASTDPLSVYQISGGLSGLVDYQRAGGGYQTGNTVYDGDTLQMS